jgi:hypothetical protein
MQTQRKLAMKALVVLAMAAVAWIPAKANAALMRSPGACIDDCNYAEAACQSQGGSDCHAVYPYCEMDVGCVAFTAICSPL